MKLIRNLSVMFLCLIGGSLLVSMPYLVQSFRPFDSMRLSSISKALHPCHDGMASISTSAPASSTALSAHHLTTALEDLWQERIADGDGSEHDGYQYLSWLDLEEIDIGDIGNDDGACSTTNTAAATSLIESSINQDKNENMANVVPLYPLSEVYLPLSTTATASDTNVNHTLNNVEPQNVQMALDLLSNEAMEPPRFCVVLRAIDTGRIANVANMLRIVDADIHKISGTTTINDGDDSSSSRSDGEYEDIRQIVRIRLTCRSEGLAEIIGVENGSGWRQTRLLRSNEYLRARVRPILAGGSSDDTSGWWEIYNAIKEDLRMIKLIYQIQLGSEDFPPETLLRLGNEIQEFPGLQGDAPLDEADSLLWRLAQEWQSVCMTLRQGRQVLLESERNERMVAAACASGGPLKLPIHMSDIDPESRREVQRLDQEFQEDHEISGMDPVLDFQVLIGLPTTKQRYSFLAKLVARERHRLEEIASSSSRRG
mmetsp:Transcript_95744/g.194650  ORF Transcript_95744/g.194650 Transcript_95744/m.194650 type:complete len:485 (+) Transcript_95744:111-1565(+)